MKFALLFFSLVITAHGALSDKDLDSIGHRVWQNECAGSRDGLTSWNDGENFASLGIGHFIWYPRGVKGPFEESFPKLVGHLLANDVRLPEWLDASTDCPWNNKAEFQAQFNGSQMRELRDLLASTIRLQSRFLAARMHNSLGQMLVHEEGKERERIRNNFLRLQASGPGTFALIDYVNFKGEGIKQSERYKGEGWGLLQVLGAMEGGRDSVADFANAAARVLERRVENSPPERNESRWLPGWKTRVAKYKG